ncbi:MAG: O-antigen ligase family protein [Alphaproteobacteria bacterium]|nr:O-antigen ligase family protein [Alphaproteobacteria bacterium]
MEAIRQHLQRLLVPSEGSLRTFEVIAGASMTLVLIGLVLALDAKVVLGGLVAIIAGIYFFAKPKTALLAIFFIRVVIDMFWWVPATVGGLNLLEAFGGGVAALAAVLFYLELRRVERQPGFVPLLLYLGAMAVAVVRSGQLRDAAEIMAKYVSPFLLMFLVSTLMDTHRRRRAFMILITAASSVTLSVSLYHLATGQRFTHFRQGYYRLIGGYANLHNHGLFLLVINTLFFFWFMASTRRRHKMLALLGGALSLICLYYTFVRTAMVGLAVFLLVFLVLERRWSLLAGAMVAAVGLLLTNASLQDRFYDIIAVFSEDDGSKRTLGSGRIGIWTSSIAEFLKRPPMDILMGLGLGGHYEVTDAYADLYRSTKKRENLDSHNDYLTLLFQLGPIAVACYLYLQGIVIRRGLELHRWGKRTFDGFLGRYLVALCAAVFITNFLSNSFISRITVAWLFWGSVGILFSSHRELKEQIEREAEAEDEPVEVEVEVA